MQKCIPIRQLGGGKETTLRVDGALEAARLLAAPPALPLSPSAAGVVFVAVILAEAAATAAAVVGALEEEKDRLCFMADLSFSPPSWKRTRSLNAGEPEGFLALSPPPPLLEEEEKRWREGGAGEQGVDAVNANAGTEPATPPPPPLPAPPALSAEAREG